MISNLLCLNSATTEFLLLGLKPQLNRITILLFFSLIVTQFLLLHLLVTLVSFLILVFPSDHISSVSRACFYHIRDLRRIRHVLDSDTAHIIGTSFVHSRLDYCNSMYYCLSQTQLNRLQHIQNALARVVVFQS